MGKEVVSEDELVSSILDREDKLQGLESDMAYLWWEQGYDLVQLQEKTELSLTKLENVVGITRRSIKRYMNIFNNKALTEVLSNGARVPTLKLTARVCEDIVKLSYEDATEAIENGVMPTKEELEVDWEEDEPIPDEVEDNNNEADGDETMKQLLEKNRKLSNENLRLKKKLKKMVDDYEYANRLASVLKGLAINMRSYEKDDRTQRRAYKNNNSLLQEALMVLGYGVNQNPTLSEAKKVYREQAKVHHPDAGGDENKFKLLNDAYEAVKQALK